MFQNFPCISPDVISPLFIIFSHHRFSVLIFKPEFSDSDTDDVVVNIPFFVLRGYFFWVVFAQPVED